MKKAIIGIAILGIFAAYSLGSRHDNPVIAKPASLAGGSSSSAGSASASSNTDSAVASGSSPPGNTPSTSGSSTTDYKDGTYTGSVADAFYGNVQVAATIIGGKITDVKFLQYPDSHDTSVMINQQAMPYLKQEAIRAQNAHVQIVSGATFTSQAFQQSLQAALSQA